MSIPIQLTYFDTAMVLLEIDGVRILTDPVLDSAGTVFDLGPVRLEKTAGPAARAADLDGIDAVLLSHDQHPDNFDTAGRQVASKAPLVITTQEGAARLSDCKAVGLSPWEETKVQGRNGKSITVMSTPARHGPEELEEFTGPVTGFMVSCEGLQNGPIYISGDTVRFDGTTEIARRYAPVGFAILHLGKVQSPAFGAAELTMSAREAVVFAKELQARRIVPVHFDGWAHFTESRDAAQQIFDASDVAARTHWLRPGERMQLA